MSTGSKLSPEQIRKLEDQLNTIIESQKYLLYLTASTLISYNNLEIQKQQIIDSLNNVNTTGNSSDIEDYIFQMRMISSALVIEALTFYFNLSKQISETDTDNAIENNSNKVNHFLDGLALFIIYERVIDNIITYKNRVLNPEDIDLT